MLRLKMSLKFQRFCARSGKFVIPSEIFKSLTENKYYQIFWRTVASFALLMALAQAEHTPKATADTIPETPASAPHLGDLDCSAYYKLLMSAELEVFGKELEYISAASEPNEELPMGTQTVTSQVSSVEKTQPSATLQSPLTNTTPWMLTALNRPTNPRLEFRNTPPISQTISLTLAQSSEIISFTILRDYRVVADSGVPTYFSQILQQMRNENKLISGPNLIANYYLDQENCKSDDDHGHYSGEFSLQFDDEPRALVQLGEHIPFTDIHIKALDFGNYSQWNVIIQSILLAGKLQAPALNISIGGNAGPETQAQIQKAIDYAASQGTIIFAATGNNNNEWMSGFFPACASHATNLVRVLATTIENSRVLLWKYSNARCNNRPGFPIAAPGVGLSGKDKDGKPATLAGTSFANPLISFAFMLQLRNKDGSRRTNQEALAELIARTRLPLPEEQYLGGSALIDITPRFEYTQDDFEPPKIEIPPEYRLWLSLIVT